MARGQVRANSLKMIVVVAAAAVVVVVVVSVVVVVVDVVVVVVVVEQTSGEFSESELQQQVIVKTFESTQRLDAWLFSHQLIGRK